MRERKSWWDRNWWWVLGGGCLVPVLACAGLVGIGALFVKNKIVDFGPYRDAVEMATSHPVVVEELGEPIETGFARNSQIRVSNDDGSADLTVPLTGSRKSGRLRVRATKSGGDWAFDKVTVRIDGLDEAIDLLEQPGTEPPGTLAPD